MAPISGTSDWRIIAKQVTIEMDSQKLSALVGQLCAALDKEAEERDRVRRLSFAPQFPRSTGAIADALAEC
jgi:hypothetical protein